MERALGVAFLMRVNYDLMRLRQYTFVWHLPGFFFFVFLKGLGRLVVYGGCIISDNAKFICYL